MTTDKQAKQQLANNIKEFIETATLNELSEIEAMIGKRRTDLSKDATSDDSAEETLLNVPGVTIAEDGTIHVIKQYNPAFIQFAHGQHAKWNPVNKSWDFSASSRDQLVAALQQIYGEVIGADKLVTVQYRARDFDRSPEGVKFGPIVTAIRPDRDAPVRLMNNTRIISGDFASRGGSSKYPSVADDNTPDAENPTLESKIPQRVYDGLTDAEKAKLTLVSK